MNEKLFHSVMRHKPPSDQSAVLGFCRNKAVFGGQNLLGEFDVVQHHAVMEARSFVTFTIERRRGDVGHLD